MNVEKLTDLELAKALSEQQDILSQSVQNVMILKQELAKRLGAKNDKVPTDTVKP